jgi:hypothetical protein
MRQFWPVKSKELIQMSTLFFKFGIAANHNKNLTKQNICAKMIVEALPILSLSLPTAKYFWRFSHLTAQPGAGLSTNTK